MRRSIHWSAPILLAAATGAVLGAVFATLDAPPAVEPRDDGTVAAAWAFYDAVDAVLGFGNTSALETAVADDYVDHAPAPGLPPTRDGLAHALLALRVTNPDLRLVPKNLTAAGGRVVAQVDVEGDSAMRFLDLSLGRAFAPWGSIDLLGVDGGRIVERWGVAAEARFERLAMSPLGTLAGTQQVLSLSRWTFPPQTGLDVVTGEGMRLLVAPTSGLAVTIIESPHMPTIVGTSAGSPPTPVPPGTTLTLAAGAALVLPRATSIHLSNEAGSEIAALIGDIAPPGSGEFGTVRLDPAYPQPAVTADATGAKTFPGGVTMRPLAISRTSFLPGAPAAIGVGRMVLAAGTELPPITADGPELIALESGSLDLNVGSSEAWVRWGNSGASIDAAKTSLGAGDGADIPPGSDLSLRNSGADPASLLIFAVMPTAPDAAG